MEILSKTSISTRPHIWNLTPIRIGYIAVSEGAPIRIGCIAVSEGAPIAVFFIFKGIEKFIFSQQDRSDIFISIFI